MNFEDFLKNPFYEHAARKLTLGQYLDWMKREPGKSPFDEKVIDFLELLLDYVDKGPAF